MKKLKKIMNFNTYYWLIKCAKPYTGSLFLIFLLNILLSTTPIAMAIVSRQLIDLAVEKDLKHASMYIAIFSVLLLLQIGLSGVSTMITTRVSEVMGNRMQREFLHRLYSIEWSALNKYHSGDVLTRLTSDIGNIVGVLVSIIPNIFSLGIQLIVAFITLLYFDPMLAAFAFVVGPVSVICSWLFGRKLKKFQHFIQSAESRCRAYMHELVRHMLIIKTFEHNEISLKRLSQYQQDKLQWVIRRNNLSVATNFVLSSGYWVGYFLAFGWGAYRLSLGSTSFGTFTAFLQLVGQVQGPFSTLSRTLPQVISAMASAERLIEFEGLEIEEKRKGPALYSSEILGVCMERVSFGYKREKQILSDVSLTVNPGEIVALIGASGEGKTTLIRMLLSLLQPADGKIYLTGKSNRLRPVSADTRIFFSYVPQGNTLFSGTIAENLRIGCPNASEEELIDSAKVACAWEFIQSLPEGLNTMIGEGGLGLSEGQAQRLSIARAILKKAPILLLDEATSALDHQTEQAVLENIRQLRPARTCIAITHRITVFDICDHIYRLSEGILLEQKADTFHSRRYANG
ncbi:MAG: ABC transporter ATP-binding protein/permease [Clostridia bacterium]|nr:ABC transporter ATP-binding protein/permease [Clostridia bacterium]